MTGCGSGQPGGGPPRGKVLEATQVIFLIFGLF
jgi:hypothetical protein